MHVMNARITKHQGEWFCSCGFRVWASANDMPNMNLSASLATQHMLGAGLEVSL